MTEFGRNGFWLTAVSWILLMVSDNLLSIVAVRMYRAGARRHLLLEDGSEINPLFSEDVVYARPMSPSFVAVVVGGYVVAWGTWTWVEHFGGDPEVFDFLSGLMLLFLLPVHVCRLRTLLIFYYLVRSRGVQGRLSVSGWLGARMQAVDLAAGGLLFFLLLLVSGRVFFGGGAASCLMMALVLWRRREGVADDAVSARDRKDGSDGTATE